MARRALPFLFGALAAAGGAHAGDNDLQLYRLGHPDDIRICTKCDGTDTRRDPGDPAAQTRFARLTASLGLAFVPAFQDPAQTTGEAGFEVGLSAAQAFVKLAPQEWPSAGTLGVVDPPRMLLLPTLTVRKGLGGSLEVGAAVSYLTQSRIVGLSAQARWAVLDGLSSAPDVALRAYATRVVGVQDLNLTVGGADLGISKSFGAFGAVKLQPYAQYGIALIHATSGTIDFRPGFEDPADPTADDSIFHTVAFLQNRYHHAAVGLRLVVGAIVFGVEGGVLLGTNPVTKDSLPGGVPQQFTRVFSASGRLGAAF